MFCYLVRSFLLTLKCFKVLQIEVEVANIYFIILVNENRYEGEWKDDQKHGSGKFYHYGKGQVFVGTWVNGVAKCGVMEDFNRETATQATQYQLPEVRTESYSNKSGCVNITRIVGVPSLVRTFLFHASTL